MVKIDLRNKLNQVEHSHIQKFYYKFSFKSLNCSSYYYLEVIV